jgi:hypothetical protein
MNTFFDSDEFDQCTEFELQTCYKYSNGVKSHRSKGDSEADRWMASNRHYWKWMNFNGPFNNVQPITHNDLNQLLEQKPLI